MRGIVKIVLLSIGAFYMLNILYCCALIKPQAKFSSLIGNLPPEALKVVNPDDVEVITGEPPIGEEYIELIYITVYEGWTFPIIASFYSKENIIEMVRSEAAEHGADAVINFRIEGERAGERKAKGIAIVYKKRRY